MNTMNKIIAIALTNAFPTIDINVLMEIINATGNPTVATELLLGIYEAPDIPVTPKDTLFTQKVNCKLMSYDKFTQYVKFSYNQATTQSGWISNRFTGKPKETDIVSMLYESSEAAKEIGMEVELFRSTHNRITVVTGVSEKVCFDSISLESWMK